jgi:hypothetical protein
MTKDEWTVHREMLGIIAEIATNANVYSLNVAKRLEALDIKLKALPLEETEFDGR